MRRYVLSGEIEHESGWNEARERMGLSVGVDEIGRGSVGKVAGCNLFVTFVADTPM